MKIGIMFQSEYRDYLMDVFYVELCGWMGEEVLILVRYSS